MGHIANTKGTLEFLIGARISRLRELNLVIFMLVDVLHDVWYNCA